jgi:phosphate transport system substrate-binding protein
MKGKWIGVWCVALVLLSLVAFACTKAQEPAAPGGDTGGAHLTGTIRVSGAWALYPMMVRWGEEFGKLHPQVRVDVSAGGAGKGAADALAGLVDIGMISRGIKAEEINQGAFFVAVVKDAVFPTINSANPVLKDLAAKGLKRQTLIDLYGSEKPLTWNQLVGAAGKDKVQVYTRSDSCGAAETWAQYLGLKAQEELKGVGVYGDPGLAEAVRRDPLGIGYNNLNYAFDAKTGQPVEGIRVASLDVNENGQIDPEEDLSTKANAIKAVLTGVYPSPPARDLYLMTKTNFKGPAKEFVKWILTDGQKYVGEVGYIQLTDQVLKEALAKAGQ